MAVDLCMCQFRRHKIATGVEVANLRLDEDKVDEQNNHIMLDIFVGEAFAARALR